MNFKDYIKAVVKVTKEYRLDYLKAKVKKLEGSKQNNKKEAQASFFYFALVRKEKAYSISLGEKTFLC